MGNQTREFLMLSTYYSPSDGLHASIEYFFIIDILLSDVIARARARALARSLSPVSLALLYLSKQALNLTPQQELNPKP